MTKTVTAAQMRYYDQTTINQIGIPSLVLMERAALAARDEILAGFPLSQRKVVIVAGSGNNGGDGLALARLLHIAGVNVAIINVGNPDHASKEHQTQEHICRYYNIPESTDLAELDQATMIVDAIFGIGINRPVSGNYAKVIEKINHTTAVKADATVTFAFNKVGLTKDPGRQYAGRIVLADDMGTYETK